MPSGAMVGRSVGVAALPMRCEALLEPQAFRYWPGRRASARCGARPPRGRSSSSARRRRGRRRTSASSCTRSAKRSSAAPDWRAPRNSPGPADLEVAARDLEAVVGLEHRLQARLRVSRQRRAVEQHADARRRAAADPAAQLVQLRQAEALGVLDHHQRRVRHVDADLDHRRRDQHRDLAAGEERHHRRLLGRRHAAVQQADRSGPGSASQSWRCVSVAFCRSSAADSSTSGQTQ